MCKQQSFAGVTSAQSRFSRRGFLAGGLMLAVAACTQTLMEEGVARSVTVQRISVLTDNITHYSVRGLPISRARFADELRNHIQQELGERAQPAGNAELIVVVKRVWLKSPGESFFMGGPSFIDAEVTVRRVSDGGIIAGPTKFSGVSQQQRLGGIFGAISAPSAQDDYQQTLRGFAIRINQALFEGGATTY